MAFVKTIRILTVAPLMALLLLIGCTFTGGVYRSSADLILSIACLTVLPLLAYPLQPFCPHYKTKGREGQRNLAIVFAVIGYLAGTVYSVVFKATARLLLVFLTYLCSGILIFLSTAVLHVKASGHACGIVGPAALAVFLHVPFWWIGIPLYVIVMLASIKMKRHTAVEFVLGGIIPAAVAVLLSLMLKIIVL